MTAPTEIVDLRERLLELYRLRDEVRRQYDGRRRALHDVIAGRPGSREALRVECAERRRLLAALEVAIDDGAYAIARFYFATRGAPCSLGELVAELTTTPEGGRS